MATLNDLVTTGKLVCYKADLAASEQKNRLIYLAPTFIDRLEGYLDYQPMDKGRDLAPSEQVEQFFDEFVSGQKMVYGHVKKIDPLHEHVWEFKTTDVRVFGYFHNSGIFIAVDLEMRKNLKPASKYSAYRKAVVEFRKDLGLAFMQNENVHDLI